MKNFKDTRRIAGPENTTPLHYLRQSTASKQFLGENQQRQDGRSSLDLRKIYMGVGNISQSKGSSYLEMGGTKVICGVYGPKECAQGNTFRPIGKVYCELKFAPFCSAVHKSYIPDRQVKELGTQVKEALEGNIILEQYPKSQIDVFITVIEEGGSVLSACINAAGLALAHAKIHMYDIIVSTSLVWHEDVPYLDPTLAEEALVREAAASPSSNGLLTVALMPAYAKGQVALFVQSGTVTAEHLQEGMDTALDGCKKLYSIVKEVLLNSVKVDDEKEKS